MRFKDQGVLVTGGASGIGEKVVAAFGREGAIVAVGDRDEKGAERVAEAVRKAGGRAHAFALDVTDPKGVASFVARGAERLGRLDVLVNSAAVMRRLGFEETTPEQYDAILALNLRSLFFCTQGAAPALRAARGKVVNLADLAGLQPWPGFAAHSVSKAGVVMLTKVLARSLAPEVTVNAIAPGAVLVPEEYDAEERGRLAKATPLGRLGSPGDVVSALLYLLESGDFVTGEVLTVDGGRLLR
jgi:pteridine reductase